VPVLLAITFCVAALAALGVLWAQGLPPSTGGYRRISPSCRSCYGATKRRLAMEPKRGIRIIWAKNGVELEEMHHAKLKRVSSIRS
jgi:hypothetical protein